MDRAAAPFWNLSHLHALPFKVLCFRFRAQGLGLRVKGLGFRVIYKFKIGH